MVSIRDDWVRLTDDDLYHQFSMWFKDLCHSRVYSSSYPQGRRIPWRLAVDAMKAPEWKNAFQQPGCYLFATREGMPRSVGQTTKQTLSKRLRRYVSGKHSQCEIAERYELVLVDHGWKGLPDDVLASYFKGFSWRKWKKLQEEDPRWSRAPDGQVAEYFRKAGGETDRLRDAADFARQGPTGIWVVIFPLNLASDAKILEAKLTEAVGRWNLGQGYPPLNVG